MRVCFILTMLCFIILGSCSQTNKTKNEAEIQMQKTLSENMKDPNFKLEDVKNVYSNDSIAIFHFNLTGKNGFGNEITDKFEYVYLVSDSQIYDGFLQLSADSVYQNEETWNKQKIGKIYENLDYDNSIVYRVIDFINNNGRNINDKFKEEEVNIMPPTKTGRWSLHTTTDKFGEKTSNKYLTLSGTGNFSNSATSHSDLYAIIFVNKGLIQLKLLEYGSLTLKDNDAPYKVSIKDSEGNEYPTMIFANDGNGQIFPLDLTNESYQQLFSILKKGGQVSFNIIYDNYRRNEYQFKVQADGFEEAFKYL